MNVPIGRSLPWILGSVAMLAVVGAILAGVLLSAGSSQATTAVPQDTFTGTVPTTDPVDASLAPASPEFATVIENEGGNPIAPEQVTVIPTNVEICYTDTQTGVEECKSPEDTALLEDWNPVRTQHTFTVKVTQANGAAAANVPVELILNRFGEAVGDIVSIDGGAKEDNTFGNVTTNRNGEADFVITSTRAGDTDVTAYVPGISDADAHKVFAVKHWVDMNVVFPGDDTNPAGTPHEMTVLVFKPTAGMTIDGTPVQPLSGVTVQWDITDNDPAGTLTAMSTVTDANGMATVTLNQDSPATGANTVTMSVVDDSDRVMFQGSLVKTWVAQELIAEKDGPDTLGLHQRSGDYQITITNHGDADATSVEVVDTLPSGLKFVSAVPAPASMENTENGGGTVKWELGTIAANEGSATIQITLEAVDTGNQTNSAVASSLTATDERQEVDPASHNTSIHAGTLAIEKTCDENVNVNATINCSIVVENTSTDAALRNVVVTDSPASELIQAEGTTLEWTAGTLDPGAEQTYNVSFTAPNASGSYDNTATATSDDHGSVQDTATIRVTDPGFGATASISDQNPNNATENYDPVSIGDTAKFFITVRNQGGTALNNVYARVVIDTDYFNLEGTTAGSMTSNSEVRYDIGTLDANGSRSFEVTVTATNSNQFAATSVFLSYEGSPEAQRTEFTTIRR